MNDFEVKKLDTNRPRGIRNNNPGNIRKGQQWVGMCENQTDDSFLQFDDPRFGIRAMARLLKNYEQMHGINTIEGVVSRWAPSSENNTESYIKAVTERAGIDRKHRLLLSHDQQQLARIIAALIHHENGQQPYSERIIREGIELA